MLKLKKDYTLNYKDYGYITVPKGTQTDNNTAMGIDKSYNFVSDYEWIENNYPSIARVLKHDVYYYGINVPEYYLERG
jgi:hypothetical protein